MNRDREMTFGEHLEELRSRVIKAVVGVLVAALACGLMHRELLNRVVAPYRQATSKLAREVFDPYLTEETEATFRVDDPETWPTLPPEKAEVVTKIREARIILGSPLTGYVTTILLCIMVGTLIASPWVLYQVWAFIGVGLHPHERRFVYRYGPFSFLLFLAGASLFYLWVLPMGLQALMTPTATVANIEETFALDQYVRFVAWMTIVFGLAFQTPIVVLFLARTRIVPFESLVANWKYVILVMMVLGAVFTPQDPVTMVLLAVPLVALYAAGLLLAWPAERRRRREVAAEEAAWADGRSPYDDLRDDLEDVGEPDEGGEGAEAGAEDREFAGGADVNRLDPDDTDRGNEGLEDAEPPEDRS